MSDRIGVFNHGPARAGGHAARGVQRAGHAFRGAVRRRGQRAGRRARRSASPAAARAMLRPERIRLGDADGARASGVVARSAVLRRVHARQGRMPPARCCRPTCPRRRHAPCPSRRHRAPALGRARGARAAMPLARRPLTRARQRERRRRHRRRCAAAAVRPAAPRPTCCTRGAACCCWRCSAPALLWFGVVYLGCLFALLANAFFGLDDFTGQVVRELTLKNFIELGDAGQRRRGAAHASTMAVLRHAGLHRARLSRSPTTWRAMRAARRRRCCTSR